RVRSEAEGQVTNLSIHPRALDATACQTCGACCTFSREWPRFSLEDDTAIERIPLAFVDDKEGRMRCDGDRCSALVGDVGVSTACVVYSARPDVCKLVCPEMRPAEWHDGASISDGRKPRL